MRNNHVDVSQYCKNLKGDHWLTCSISYRNVEDKQEKIVSTGEH